MLQQLNPSGVLQPNSVQFPIHSPQEQPIEDMATDPVSQQQDLEYLLAEGYRPRRRSKGHISGVGGY